MRAIERRFGHASYALVDSVENGLKCARDAHLQI